MSFNKFTKEVEQANDCIVLKEASKTKRKGAPKIRDKIVFGKVSWGEALTYLGIIQTAVIFFGLMDDVIINVNGFLTYVGIQFQFPLGISVGIAFLFILCVVAFGIIAVRVVGTYKSSLELGTKMNPGFYLLWRQNDELRKEVDALKKELKK